MDDRHLCDRRERLIVIDVVHLRDLGRDLVPVNGAVSIVFYLIHPLASDRLHSLEGINEVPCLVFSQCMHLFLHC